MIELLLLSVVSSQWVWTNEANFDNAKRWSKNMTRPCGGQTVTFDSQLPTSVMIRESFSLGVLNLPNNGEIILNDNLIIGVDPSISGCSDTEPVRWISTPDSWFDSSNWLNTAKKRLDFVPDEQTIPCQNSLVTLPQESTFMIASESTLLAESVSIKPWGNPLTSDSALNTYKQTDWGRYQIPSLNVNFNQEDCDSTGCLCHKTQYHNALRDYLCARKICDEVKCSDPFIPAGNCCPVCGAQINLDYNEQFNFADFERYLDDQISADYSEDTIQYKAYKSWLGDMTRSGTKNFQIVAVFSDLDGTESYAKSEAKKLSKSLKSFPGVVGVSIEYSGKAPSGMTGGAIFGVIVLVVLVPIVVGFVYVKRDSLPSFSAFTNSFSNQNYQSNMPTSATPTQSVPMDTDYGAFALTSMAPVSTDTETTTETIVPPRKKKKAAPPPPRPRVENPNYQSTVEVDTDDNGIRNEVFETTSTTSSEQNDN